MMAGLSSLLYDSLLFILICSTVIHRCICQNSQTSSDVNACDKPETCSRKCVYKKGSFKCECETGYLLDPHDHTRCKAANSIGSLVFTDKKSIHKISLEHYKMIEIVNETKTAVGLDFVFRSGVIFWSDISEEKIYKAPIDNGSERTVVIHSEINSDGLAVDWIYNHIYWTDSGKNTIELANFEGTMRKVLITGRLEKPRALAVNPLDGWMYWTDWGNNARIERAGLDGTHRHTIVSDDIKWPNGLTLDLIHKRIFWVDAKFSLIASCNYDGSGRRTVLRSSDNLNHPFSISVFEDWVYWTDWRKNAIYRANKFNGSQITPIRFIDNIPMVIRVFHPYLQPDGTNHCAFVNGNCSHFCLPTPELDPKYTKISCVCPDGLELMSNGLTCSGGVSSNTGSENSSHSTLGSGNQNEYVDTLITTELLYDNIKESSENSSKWILGSDYQTEYPLTEIITAVVTGNKDGSKNCRNTKLGADNQNENADIRMIVGIVIGIVTLILILAALALIAFIFYLHTSRHNLNIANTEVIYEL